MVENTISLMENQQQYTHTAHLQSARHGEKRAYIVSDLSSHPVLDAVAVTITTSQPDWDAILHRFESDSRNHDHNVDNTTGALAECFAGCELERCMQMHASESEKTINVVCDPVPDEAHVGKYHFKRCPMTGNPGVYDHDGRPLTEFDGVIAIEEVNENGESEVLITVLESKLKVPTLPRRKDISHVKRYIDRKVKPLKALFEGYKFGFVMTVCNASDESLSKNQKRFKRMFEKLGGKVASLGIERSEFEALALTYV